jgi:two-component system sensor histidine kinase FlrB
MTGLNQLDSMQHLADAFGVFNQFSEQLSASYQQLEQRAAQLTDELAAARGERLRQLAEKERLVNRLQRLLAALPVGVLVLDGDGVVRECNPAAYALLGEPLLDADWREISARAFDTRRGAGREQALRDGRSVSLSYNPLGEEPGQIVVLTDVSETRALQDSLHRNERLASLGEMAASLAHQIRTPLASAFLYASQLAAAYFDHQETQRYADKIVARLRYLESLVKDMLLFAKGGSAGTENVAVSALLAETRQSVEAQARAGGCELRVRDEPRITALPGNQEALQSALQNLVTNAIQACGAGGRIEIGADIAHDASGEDMIHLYVSDNGPGVAPDLRQRIFEPFFTTRAQGTGLGLAVVQAVAQAHQGKAWVEPRAGGGSRFVICLSGATARMVSDAAADICRTF